MLVNKKDQTWTIRIQYLSLVKIIKEEDLIGVFINLLYESATQQVISIQHMLLAKEKRDNMKEKEINW